MAYVICSVYVCVLSVEINMKINRKHGVTSLSKYSCLSCLGVSGGVAVAFIICDFVLVGTN